MPTLSSSFREEDDPRKSNAPRHRFCDLIVREGGDYCMQLKGNQGDMHADIRAFAADQDSEYVDEFISIALGIIKAKTAKGSNRVKFKKAGWSNDFLRTLIEGF